MLLSQHLLALFLVMFGAGCADDMPVTARYVPADCPPTKLADDSVDAVDEPRSKDAPQPPRSTDGAEHAEVDAGSAREQVTAAVDGSLVNLNTANAAELATLPGVGPALAARIIEYRQKRAFERPEDLRRVRGIGPAKFAKLKDLISVGADQKRTP